VNAAPPDPRIDALKRELALRLGYMVMEFSRLEMELGLLLVWTHGGRDYDAMAARLRRANFNDRLRILRDHLQSRTDDHPDYATWLAEANQARKLRNHLIHGRWGFHGADAQRPISNVRGEPFLEEQVEADFTLEELDAQLAQLKALRRRLAALRESAPL
jgi:hypothetical protein